ncbi:MAG: hypothetical protein O7C03_07570 [Gammaproteobacteria bacterium]|nr:hypothetical protein [Pseudomonadota bacterium]MCH8959021.1 hypothetical protein [Pseudomonadota bacterium]MCZ6536526.1 hypothetical protein [Gammaproteobacteria bacterium]MCZ6762847.1 hypothetical protein [Gammaproteobacteria bacterium]MCZ6880052.1 hypothetical protein [Gammaproteobacteria bacterium]
MKVVPTTLLLAMVLLTTACAGVSCDTPQPYQQATLGETMQVPAGMDSPIDDSVQAIPDGEVGGEQFKNGRCLQESPSFFYGSKTFSVMPDQDDFKIPEPQAGVPEDE